MTADVGGRDDDEPDAEDEDEEGEGPEEDGGVPVGRTGPMNFLATLPELVNPLPPLLLLPACDGGPSLLVSIGVATADDDASVEITTMGDVAAVLLLFVLATATAAPPL